MKYLFMIFIAFNSTAQFNEYDKKRLDELHLRTNHVLDSVQKLIKIKEKNLNFVTHNKEIALHQIDSLWNIYDQNEIDALIIDIQYAKRHPYSLFTFTQIQNQVARQAGKNFYNDFENIYRNAPLKIKESEVGKLMAEQLKYFKGSMVGSLAPNITGIDNENNIISLVDLTKTNYVLIDFWASWCAPCREEIPFLKSLYDKYKNQGFEILSITVDEDLEIWKTAILKEQISEWKNYSLKQNNSSAKTDYFVNGIPHKVLVEKGGKIIGKWKASGELNKKSIENQLIEIFGH